MFQIAGAWPRPSPAIDGGTAVNDGIFCTGLVRQGSPNQGLDFGTHVLIKSHREGRLN